MEYTVLARRFRPQAFDEVVGQQNIAQALRNAIAAGRVAHAYLFTGARGVGKTSTARILAKSLNCPNAKEGNPCNQCDVCEAISAGSDMDVLEIDGASNNGVEQVRELRANVGVRPLRSPYKIYIIDEVHMLTTAAFNALLKTLEEPPPNVKFIFATTDPQKLPDTILSRCQRFDFGTIATKSIEKRLKEIAAAEGVEVDAAAVELVARRASGSMRDSQSLFDQLLAFGGKQIGVEAVHRLLGTAPDDRLIEFGASLIEKRRADVLKLLDACLGEGVQLTELTDQLVGYLRDLMILAAGAGGVALQSVAEERRSTLESQAKTWGLQNVLAALQIFADAKMKMKGATYGRALAELALIRVAVLEDLEGLSTIVQMIKSGKPLPAAKAPAARSEPPRLPQAERRTLPTDVKTEVEALKSPPLMTEAAPPPAPAPQGAVQAADSTVPTIPFETGRETEILAQLIARATDPIISAVRGATSIAILGPNHLAITFPRGYHIAVKQLDRPEPLGRLERVLQEVLGKPVGIRFRVEEAPAKAESKPTPPPRATTASREVENDPVIQKVISLFGAQIVRVDSIADAAVGRDGSESSGGTGEAGEPPASQDAD